MPERLDRERPLDIVAREFVPVSIEIHYAARRPDVEGRFLKDRLKRPSFNGWIAVTANGRILNEEPYLDLVLARGLARWKELPEEERKPGVALDDLGPADPSLDLNPPAGGVILNVYIRSLTRNGNGDLVAPPTIDLGNAGGSPIKAQAQRDHFWLTGAEAESLLPAKPEKGVRIDAPAFLAERICRFYLKDSPTCIPGTSAGKYGGYRGSLAITVDEAAPALLRLRLKGAAVGSGPDFQLAGTIEFDPTNRLFRRFDLVAFSEKGHVDKGTHAAGPLGIAFELTPGEKAMDRVPPYFFTLDRWGGDPRSMIEAYFGARK